MASLWMGAVTTASISPARADWIAFAMLRKAACPASAEILPYVRSLMQHPSGSSTSAPLSSIPRAPATSVKIDLLPINSGRQSLVTRSQHTALTAISGPMPLGSPIVIPMVGLAMLILESVYHFAIGSAYRADSENRIGLDSHSVTP